MKFLSPSQWRSWLPQLGSRVWILAFGRLLSDLGTGFTLFYAPIFFVNKVGLSATAVGLALGSASISGVLGRVLGGSFADSRFWGRRRTLLLALLISAIGSLVLARTINFTTLVIGNLIAGLGAGLYWPATEAMIADLTPPEHRRDAYAITRLADNLGMGMGIVFGGVLIATTGNYRSLFIIDAISFIIFLAVVYIAIPETYTPDVETRTIQTNSWREALSDRRLLVFALVNIIFTTYISQLQSTLPLYFKNFVSVNNTGGGFTETTISTLFALHLALAILSQLPISRALRRFSHPQALSISAVLWAGGFILIWVTGVAPSSHLAWATCALAVFAIATVSYTPSASALITDLAPESQRGVYFSINSLCWAVGYLIGPPLGGWALDQSRVIVYGFWLSLALSTIVTIGILQYLSRLLAQTDTNSKQRS